MYATDSAITRFERDAGDPFLPDILNSLPNWFYVALLGPWCMMTGICRAIVSDGALATGGDARRGVPGCRREKPPGKGDL